MWIGWLPFRGSPTLQLKGPPRLAARRAPPGPANLAIQPPLSQLSALAPLSEKPGAVSSARKKMAKVAKDLNPGVQKVSCDMSVFIRHFLFPFSLSHVFVET